MKTTGRIQLLLIVVTVLAAGLLPSSGTDTLRSVEAIWGTEYADVYDASTFTAANAPSPSTNAGNTQNSASDPTPTNW